MSNNWLHKLYDEYCPKCRQSKKVSVTLTVNNWCKLLQALTYMQPNEEVLQSDLNQIANLIVRQVIKKG